MKANGKDQPKVSKQPVRRRTSWAKLTLFAALSLVCFVFGAGLLAIMLWKAQMLVALGLVGKVYYIVLLPLGLAAAAFLFGVLRSYGCYSGKQFGGTLELGGPVVGFVLVLILGFFLPKAEEAFALTVHVHGEAGAHDLVLRNAGVVWITLGADRRQEKIGDKGQADFKNIPNGFRGQDVPIWVEADGFETVDPEQKHKLDAESLYLAVRRKAVRLTGRVQDEAGQPIAGATIRAAGLSTESDAGGHFALTFRDDRAQNEVTLEVSAAGYELWRARVLPRANETIIMLREVP